MSKLPRITGDELIRALRKVGFQIVRQKGSHVRLKSPDGRVTTVSIHKGRTLPPGLIGSGWAGTCSLISDNLTPHKEPNIKSLIIKNGFLLLMLLFLGYPNDLD